MQASPNGNSLVGPHVIDLCRQADLVFLALHGAEGENGKVQALFDLYGIHYTGSGYIGSLLAMDKDLAKRMLVQSGVPTPEWILLDLATTGEQALPAEIGFPCVVKPCSSGSSVGVSIVNDESEFQTALTLASQYESQILVEKMIKGREFSIGILDGEALPVIEIIPKTRFYDYQNKYQAGMTDEICPAELEPETSSLMQALAVKAHHALRLGFYSRIDFLLDAQGDMFCLEANTLPGMTPTSLLPQEAQAVGISYRQLCEKIAAAALAN
jgi:D-alanine-D-alanine ligase